MSWQWAMHRVMLPGTLAYGGKLTQCAPINLGCLTFNACIVPSSYIVRHCYIYYEISVHNEMVE